MRAGQATMQWVFSPWRAAALAAVADGGHGGRWPWRTAAVSDGGRGGRWPCQMAAVAGGGPGRQQSWRAAAILWPCQGSPAAATDDNHGGRRT